MAVVLKNNNNNNGMKKNMLTELKVISFLTRSVCRLGTQLSATLAAKIGFFFRDAMSAPWTLHCRTSVISGLHWQKLFLILLCFWQTINELVEELQCSFHFQFCRTRTFLVLNVKFQKSLQVFLFLKNICPSIPLTHVENV